MREWLKWSETTMASLMQAQVEAANPQNGPDAIAKAEERALVEPIQSHISSTADTTPGEPAAVEPDEVLTEPEPERVAPTNKLEEQLGELIGVMRQFISVTGNYSGYKQPSSPSPFSQVGRRGTEPVQSPSPHLGEGFRVRAD